MYSHPIGDNALGARLMMSLDPLIEERLPAALQTGESHATNRCGLIDSIRNDRFDESSLLTAKVHR